MKLDCGPTREEKFKAEKEWHRWFAWKRVRVGARECRWLEFVERRRTFDRKQPLGYRFCWEYRALG